jgi:hypothetical protein
LSLFVLVFVPVSWGQYGLAGFLWLCNIALLLTLAAAWLESSLLTGMAAVGVLIIQLLWLGGLLGGLAGLDVSESMRYMFDPRIPLFTRGLSLHHGWLPFLLWFMLKRLGYDRRALGCYLPLAGVVFLLCFFLVPPPAASSVHHGLPVTINFVHGLDCQTRQSWMAPGWWLLVVMVGSSLGLFLPTHLLLCRLFRPPVGQSS